MLYRKIASLVILIQLMVSLSFVGGCELMGKKPGASEKTAHKIRIGFSMATVQEERWLRDREIFAAKAKKLGAEVIVQTANNSVENQADQVRYLLQQDIDVLVIVPHDAEKTSQIVHMAKKQGVRVISYDRLVRNADVDLYISFDNVRVGEMMAEYLIQKVSKGNYIIINGGKTDFNSYMFNQGYKNVLQPYIDKGLLNIADEVWTEDWKPEGSFAAVERVLNEGYRVDAVIAANDTLAGAAIQALAERRLAGKVPVAGHDADLSGCQRIAEGTQSFTVYKPVEKLAQRAAEAAVAMAKGEAADAPSAINDGKYDIPYIMIEPVAVTRDNIRDTVIKDGFHRLEDVFRNVPAEQ